jgi:hypothetical protein
MSLDRPSGALKEGGNRAFDGTARFELVRPLGEGGMGAVFEVRDRDRGARLALKMLKATAPEALLHLKKEFRALQHLRHPNVIRLGELFEEDGRWFFTMELVDGVDLLTWVRPGAEAQSLRSGVSETRPIAGTEPARHPDGHVATAAQTPSVAGFDEQRLRDALAQLARGLGALHAAGKVHRDVKPSNVLVSREGRVVLVDFGLAADLENLARDERRAMGTAAFMAPEQAAGGAPSPASDWYAFGVLLHLALTGARPLRGAEFERRRAHERPRPVRELCPDAPQDLAALCDELLAVDPAMRPSGLDVLRRLGIDERPRAWDPSPHFVGRAAELAALRTAFEDSRRGAVTSVVTGESGLGKSMLARALFATLRAAEPTTAILAGRCYEREIVPFNAFDGIVDAMSEQLCALDAREAAQLLPEDAALLARVFPVLRRVQAIATMPSPAPATPHELRTRACSALRALLARIAGTRPLVLYLDDLQWADADSLWLLDELLTAEATPPLFVLATLRAPSPELSRLLDRLPGVRRLDLGPLDAVDARHLAAEVVGSSDGGESLASVVAREAAGHPLFLLELADHVKRRGTGELGGVRLDGALWSRIEGLDAPARRLLELLAIAGSPLPSRAAAMAADLDAGAYADCAAALSIERLARASDAHGRARVEPYHDRVREAVLGHLSAPTLRDGHLRLAIALEGAGVDDSARVGRHFADGGEPARALRYVVRAAEEADGALAFEESAGLYQRALALRDQVAGDAATGEADAAAPDALELAAAEALSAAGHGKEAARLWMNAAGRAADLARIELHRRAAEELFTHGLLDEGYAVLETVLADLGLSVPRSKLSVLWRVLSGQVRNALFGHRLRVRTPPASERELARVDVIGGITLALWSMDPLTGVALQADHLRLALEAGDPLRAAFALAMEGGASAVGGLPAQARTRRWLDEAEALARTQSEEPRWRAGHAVTLGTVAVLEGRWMDAMGELDVAERELAQAPLGHAAIRELMRNMRLTALFWLGRAGDLLRQSPNLLRRAEERGNLDSWAWLQTFDAWALSCAGRPGEAHERLALLEERLPGRGFLLHRWYMDHARVVALLSERRGDEAFRAIKDVRRKLRFAPAGQAQRVWSRWLLANAALGRVSQVPGDRAAMLAEARRVARRMEAERTPWVGGAAACVRACIASVEGHVEDAARELAQAEPLLAAHHFEAYLACVRAARARLVGGDRGVALRAQADAWFADQLFTREAQWMALPGFPA